MPVLYLDSYHLFYMERYNRQIILPEIGEEGQKKINNAKVLIVGMGGLGSPIALYLAGAGVGTLGLIDGDTVDCSNLQRQILYGEDETGLPKAQQAKARIEKLNTNITIHAYNEPLTPDNAERIITCYDIVVDGCDNFTTRYLINDTCVKLNKIYVYGAIRAFDGQVSVFNYPGKKTNYRTLYPNEDEMQAIPAPPKGVLGVTPGIVGCAEASEVLKIITGFGEPLAGKLWTLDLKSMQSHIISL